MSGLWIFLNSPSPQYCVVVAFFCVVAVNSVWADGLVTPLQRQRAQNLYLQFIAPCCWRQSVAIHQSAQAIHVRAEIDEGITAGKSDDQIKTALIREYGHGILMQPQGLRAVIAYSGPLLALLIGLLILLKWVRGIVKPPEVTQARPHPITADLADLSVSCAPVCETRGK